MNKNDLNNEQIPVHFEVLKDEALDKEVIDTRFIKVKIWLMHLGENRRGTYFEKNSVTKAIPSLANTPILAGFTDNLYGETDFDNHMMEAYVEGGELKSKYVGQAIGVIPSENNAQFEERIDEEGELRTYLTVEGLIWTKWNEPVDILSRLNTVPQSMELAPNPIITKINDKEYYTDFKFFGACALGQHVQPAMSGSTIETNFSTEETQLVINKKLQEYNTHFAMVKEEVTMEKEVVKTDEEQDVILTKDNAETPVVEEKPVQKEDVVETEDSKETDNNVVEENVSDNTTEDTTENTTEDTAEGADEEKDSEDTDTDSETEVNFAVEIQEMQAQVQALTSEKEALFSENESMKAELEKLRAYHTEREHNDLRDKFSNKLDEKTLNEIFSNVGDKTLQDIETEIFATIGRLAYSQPEEEDIRIGVNSRDVDFSNSNEPYGSFFKK